MRARLSPRGSPERHVAAAVAAHERLRGGVGRVVLDHDDLGPVRRGLRRDGGQRGREVVAAAAGRDEDGGGRGHGAQRLGCPAVILLLHNRYRVPGGEERAVEDLAWLIRTELGEEAEVLERDFRGLSGRDAARGLLLGGLGAAEVADAVERTGARVVHAHNVQPSLGWRALAAARTAGARVVLHLHNYRLVCAVGTCFTHGRTARAATGATRSPASG